MTTSPQAPGLRPSLSPARRFEWETVAWLALLVATVVSRLWDLGARVMTHDESLHAFYSWELLERGAYIHDPTYHGPLLYHLNALVFFFLGASDATARLVPVLMGVGAVAILWAFRRWLGRRGALLGALLVAASPTLLFYSRHARNDIYVALFTLVWILGAMRFLDERRHRWLYVLTLAMALSFAAKEVSFIFGAIGGSFFVLLAIVDARAEGERSRRARAAGDLAILMLSLVLPFASGLGYLLLGWNPRDPHTSTAMLVRCGLLVGGLFVAAALLAWWRFRGRPAGEVRFRDWARLAAVFWGIQLVLFTTLLENLRGGLVSGIVGSLGYWLGQQEVARGGQPWFYYPMLALLYEFLPLAFGLGAAAVIAYRSRIREWDPVPYRELPQRAWEGAVESRLARRDFMLFLVWWTLTSWVAYTAAGEKMPWLLTHLVLPLCLLAGWGLGRLVDRDWSAVPRRAAGVGIGVAAVLPLVAMRLLTTRPFPGRSLDAVAGSASWLLHLFLVLALCVLWLREMRRLRRGRAAVLALLGVALLLGVLNLRVGLRLAYRTYDLATEHLSYAQATTDVKRAMREIELLSERTTGAKQLEVAYDDESSWPFVWYLRDYPRARTWASRPELARSASVILVGPKNRAALWPIVATGYSKREYQLLWWPVQDYTGMTPGRFWSALRDGDFRKRLWAIVSDRDYSHLDLTEWPLRRELDMYVRTDVLAAAGAGLAPSVGSASAPFGGAVEELDPRPLSSHTGPWEGSSLTAPTGVAIAPDGGWVIADAGNHRILVLDPDGALRLAFGGHCDLSQAGAAGCTDPDGDGPLERGDGQLNEPWGVAVGPQGRFYVADTWNHRIQVFDTGGGWITKWGRFVTGSEATAQGAAGFYGPRGLTFDPGGNLVVTDTGNKRLLVFSPAGEPLRVVGEGGAGPEELDEPVGVAIDRNDTLLVADTWNRRVKRLDRYYRTLAVWKVPGWEGQGVADKPSVAVDDRGWIYASDPPAGRVLVFSPAGVLVATRSLPRADGETPRPTGLAVDQAAGRLLVADHAGGRLLVYPLYDAGA